MELFGLQENMNTLKGYKMQFVQPINSKLENIGDPIVAVDTIGAGPGEIIFLCNFK